MSNADKVRDLPKQQLPEIRQGSVHSPGQRLNGSRNEVWLCPAYSGADDVMLYVKPGLTLRQIAAELVVAQVATAMKLPVPQPYLVVVQPHCIGRPRGPQMLAFGSEQVGPRGLATPVRNLDLMLKMLQKAKAAEGTATLDELVANDVRGPGDIVFDPEGQVWLIDHEAALDRGLKADEAVNNWLATLSSKRKLRVGFMHDGYVAQFGVLRPGRSIGADVRALKLRLFDLDSLRRDQLLVLRKAELLVGYQAAGDAFTKRQRESLNDAWAFVAHEAKQRNVVTVQCTDAEAAARHLHESLLAA